MSILIKGMEMPKKGVYFAVISFDGDSLSIRIPPPKKPFFDGRIEEIPTQHGRLIEENELLRHKYGFSQTARVIIKTTDAVIEAEVSVNA